MIQQVSTLILAIAPNSRGFGFVLFQSPKQLLDWGVKEARVDKNARCIALVTQLMERVQPRVLIIEDWLYEGCRRSARVKMLLTELANLASNSGIIVYTYSRRQVRGTFGAAGKSKDAIAVAIAESVPALLPWLPRRRRIWESEHHSMAIFEATALAVTHFAVSGHDLSA